MMDKYSGLPDETVRSVPCQAASVAEAVQKDFRGLIAIFNRQLAEALQLDRETRSTISEAKAAAERGLKLSQQLIDLLRTRAPN